MQAANLTSSTSESINEMDNPDVVQDGALQNISSGNFGAIPLTSSDTMQSSLVQNFSKEVQSIDIGQGTKSPADVRQFDADVFNTLYVQIHTGPLPLVLPDLMLVNSIDVSLNASFVE